MDATWPLCYVSTKYDAPTKYGARSTSTRAWLAGASPQAHGAGGPQLSFLAPSAARTDEPTGDVRGQRGGQVVTSPWRAE